MVRTIHVTGIASTRTTAISLGTYLGRGRVAVLTAARQILSRSHALSMHAQSHAFSGHAHSHAFSGHAIAIGSAAWDTRYALMISAGALEGSFATAMGNFPEPTGGINGVTQTGGINAVVPTGRPQMGHSLTAYTIDSYGRYVVAATHPAANHAVLKAHGAAGPRIELGNALRNTDILEITALLQGESGGIF